MRIYSVCRGGSEPETAVQRYNRLKCEAGELWEEVNGMKNEAAAGSDKKRSTAAGDINSVGENVTVICMLITIKKSLG